jgi:hypothetical protein
LRAGKLGEGDGPVCSLHREGMAEGVVELFYPLGGGEIFTKPLG